MKKRPAMRSSLRSLERVRDPEIARACATANLEAAVNLYLQNPCPEWHHRIALCAQRSIALTPGARLNPTTLHWKAPRD